MRPRRKFSKDFKMRAIRRLESGQSLVEVARALKLWPSELRRWRCEADQYGSRAFPAVRKKSAERRLIAELERKLGEQLLEIDLLKSTLRLVREKGMLRVRGSRRKSTGRSKKKRLAA